MSPLYVTKIEAARRESHPAPFGAPLRFNEVHVCRQNNMQSKPGNGGEIDKVTDTDANVPCSLTRPGTLVIQGGSRNGKGAGAEKRHARIMNVYAERAAAEICCRRWQRCFNHLEQTSPPSPSLNGRNNHIDTLLRITFSIL